MADDFITTLDDSELRLKLNTIFGYEQFRSNIQKNAVKTVLSRSQDVFLCTPRSSGKSLCFQLPAAIQESKVTVVFSPFLVVINDQLNYLKKLNIAADTINFTMDIKEKVALMDKFGPTDVDIKLLYVTPEQAFDETFTFIVMGLHRRNKLSCIVVDEAQCVSRSSQDFNHYYQKLGKLRSIYPNIPWVALMENTIKAVESDIMQELGFTGSVTIYKDPCFRSNIYYDVAYKDIIDNPEAHMVLFLSSQLDLESSTNQGNAIVYCRTERSAMYINRILKEYSIPAAAYIEGLEDKEKESIQENWITGKYLVLITTLKFNEKIINPSVRCIVHWCMPKSLTTYYYETGHAGRDGCPAWCRIYYSIVEKDASDSASTNTVSSEVKKVVNYCVNARCRHVAISECFEDTVIQCDRQCDVCVTPEIVETNLRKLYLKVSQHIVHSTNLEKKRDTPDHVHYNEHNYVKVSPENNNKEHFQLTPTHARGCKCTNDTHEADCPATKSADSSTMSSGEDDCVAINKDADVISLSSDEADSDIEVIEVNVPSKNPHTNINKGLIPQTRSSTIDLTVANCFKKFAKKQRWTSISEVVSLLNESDSEHETSGGREAAICVSKTRRRDKEKRTLNKAKQINSAQPKKEKVKISVSREVISQVTDVVIRSLMTYYNCGKISDSKLIQNATRLLVKKYLKEHKHTDNEEIRKFVSSFFSKSGKVFSSLSDFK